MTRGPLFSGAGARIGRIAWSPDGELLAASTAEEITIWNVATAHLHARHRPPKKGATIWDFSWSPDGKTLAIACGDEVALSRVGTSEYKPLRSHSHEARVYSVDWSPKGELLASGSGDHTVCVTDRKARSWRLDGHSRPVYAVAFSPDGRHLASASKDRAVCLWEGPDWALRSKLSGHTDAVTDVAWSPEGVLASASIDGTIRIWNVDFVRTSVLLEAHKSGVYSVAFSPSGALLASTSADRSVILWDAKSWQQVAGLKQPDADYGYYWPAGAIFGPAGQLAALEGDASEVRVTSIDVDSLRESTEQATQHSTAKVVLYGDSGVGKTALARALAGQAFAATTSEPSSVMTMSSGEDYRQDGSTVLREILLFDFAAPYGSGYRLLPLNQVRPDVALIVFDATWPDLASIRNWIRVARQTAEQDALPIILVGARADRGASVDIASVRNLGSEMNVVEISTVSTLVGSGIASLQETIQRSIRWDTIPLTSSSALVQNIKTSLLDEKRSGRQVATADELFRAVNAKNREAFDMAIRLLHGTGVIRILGVGDVVLLQPELLEHYAAGIVRVARDEPDGLGAVPTRLIGAGALPGLSLPYIPPEHQRVLLNATMQELLAREVAFLDGADSSAFLVFPTEVRRERPSDAPLPRGGTFLRFTGPLAEIYANVIVRLQYSDAFHRTAFWRNSVEYAAPGGGTCGAHFREIDGGRGELQLTFTSVSDESQATFIEYVRLTLEKTAARGSIEQSRAITCPTCGEEISERQIAARLSRGHNDIICPVCGTRISLTAPAGGAPTTSAFDRSAEVGRERSEAAALLQAKIAAGDFDVYLSFNKNEAPAVHAIARRLREFGILPWIFEEQVGVGRAWKDAIAEQAARSKAIAVFVGNGGIGPSQGVEIELLLNEAKARRIALIPVLLPDLVQDQLVPAVLRDYLWVDFRQSHPDPMELLVRGIAGSRGSVSTQKAHETTREDDLRKALEAAERGNDWAAARQHLLELTNVARNGGRMDEAVGYATRAFQIADDPARLDGKGLVEPVRLLAALRPLDLEPLLAECRHREHVLRELRELAVERPEIWSVIRKAGVERWTDWFNLPSTEAIATLPRGGQGWPAARVRRLRLRNIKSFRDVTFDFTSGELPRTVTTFVGDNATGKSTIMQCIALAFLGSSFAARIEGVTAQTLLRNGESSGSIELELDLAVDPGATAHERGTLYLGLALDGSRKDLFFLGSMTLGPKNHLPGWSLLRSQVGLQWGYCGGYGAFRALRERRDTLASAGQTPLEIDRVLSLFQPQATLLEPAILESILQADITPLSREPSHIPLGVRDAIAAVFRNSIPGVETREIGGRLRLVEKDSGVATPSALSDGCNSMIGMLGHLIRHALELRAWTDDPTKIDGIVLVDEIDLHLHPSWQRNALPQLIAAFPNVQFIVTTHSPLVLAGMPDEDVRVLTRSAEGETVAGEAPSVKGFRVDQVLSGVHFDVDAVYDSDTEDLRKEYGRKLTELGPEHKSVQDLAERLRTQMRAPQSSTNPDKDLSALLDEFLEWRLRKLPAEQRRKIFADMTRMLE